jgi:hypothetical protein
MSVTPEFTEFSAVDEGQSFSQSVTYNNVEEGIPIIIQSVQSSIEDSSIQIEINGNTVIVTGPYNNVFPGKTFEYVPLGEPGKFLTVSFDEIPEKIDTLTTYNPVSTTSINVIYTVSTDAGIATINQTVNNTWDSGKAQMLNALSRGQY